MWSSNGSKCQISAFHTAQLTNAYLPVGALKGESVKHSMRNAGLITFIRTIVNKRYMYVQLNIRLIVI